MGTNKDGYGKFGLRNVHFDPFSGKFIHLDRFSDFRMDLFTVTEIGVEGVEGDYIVCEDAQGYVVNIGKPWLIQRTPFDGETFDGVDYAYNDIIHGYRVASKAGKFDEAQFVTPRYVIGETIRAVYLRTGLFDVDDKRIDWEDTTNRIWAVR